MTPHEPSVESAGARSRALVPGVGPTRVFRAAGIREAFAEVKRVIGSEAIILGTRDLGHAEPNPKERYEVVAAYPAGTPARAAGDGADVARRARPTHDGAHEVRAPRSYVDAREPDPPPLPPPPADDEEDAIVRRQLGLLERAIKGLEGQLAAMMDQNRALRDELSRLARSKVTAESALSQTEPVLALIDAGVEREVAERIVSRAVSRATPRRGLAVAKPPDIAGEIAQAVKVAPPLWHAPSGSVIALVGPPGAGKTTTLMKLAGLAAFAHGRSVGCVTTDTQRLGAWEHFELYAAVMGLPARPAPDRANLDQALEAFGDLDLVFIDTPGHNPFDEEARFRMMKLVSGREVRQHLVVPATLASGVMEDLIACYSGPALESLIVTKVDEARGFGPVVASCFLAELPVSHVCDGQEIPDDIHAADHERVTRAVLARAS